MLLMKSVSLTLEESSYVGCPSLSLIRTVRLHKLDPYQYFVEIMKEVSHCDKTEDHQALLPWNIELVKVTAKDQ